MSCRIESLAKHHVRDAFDCGEDSLNDFLRRFARQNDERGLGRSFVAVTPDDVRICGYYTLASGAVTFDTMPEKLPRYPVPVAHLGRLAVDRTAQGRGLGAFLLVDALKRVLKTADQIGLYAVEVYALNAQAKAFYLKYGFQPLLDDPFHLYLSIKTLRKLGLN